jgi:hypothetical protein
VVAKGWRFKLDEARQRFRLTSTEKRVIVFVLAALGSVLSQNVIATLIPPCSSPI